MPQYTKYNTGMNCIMIIIIGIVNEIISIQIFLCIIKLNQKNCSKKLYKLIYIIQI